MAWNLTMLALHLIGLLAIGVLFRHADAFQRLVLGLLGAGFMVLLYYYGAAFAGLNPDWAIKSSGRDIEHTAILLHIARIFLYDQERRCLPSSDLSKSQG